MMSVLTETAVRLGFTLWTIWKVLFVLTQDFPDNGAPRVPERVRRKLCIDHGYFLLHEMLIRYVEFDIMHGKYNIKRH
jgi:hypothetical protein